MRNHSQYLAGFGGAAFAVACFLIGLEVSATTAAPSASQTSLTINRTLKSDRMPLVSWPTAITATSASTNAQPTWTRISIPKMRAIGMPITRPP